MDNENWLVGWREIGKHIGKSAKTAHRWARQGMPFFRDPGGRPIALPWQIDQWIRRINQSMSDANSWPDKGIKKALSYDREKEKAEKEFNERYIDAQRPVRGRF